MLVKSILKRPALPIAIMYAFIVILLRPIMIEAPKAQKPINIPAIKWASSTMTSSINQAIPKPYASLLGSIVFGDKMSKLDSETKDKYKKAGLAHLLVASGTQVSILIGVCLSLFRFLKLKNSWALPIASVFTITFSLMAGCGPSIVRAAIMGEITLLGLFLNKDPDIYASLSISALILMIFDPRIIFDIGFQLSFCATWALLYLCPILEGKNIPKVVAVALAPVIATFPIILFNFSQISVFALIVNLLVMPWIEMLTILGFILALAGTGSSVLSQMLGFPILIIIKVIDNIVNVFSGVPFSAVYISQPMFVFFIAYYACLIYITEFIKGQKLFCLNKKNIVLSCLIFLAGFIWNAALMPANGIGANSLSLSIIDVGQGDSIFIKSPSGNTMLIDGGEKANGFDAGRYSVAPFLRKQGINRIDIVALTHPHNDHLGGLLYILSEMQVGMVLDTGYPYTSKCYMDFLNLIAQKKISYRLARAGQNITLGDNITCEVLWPREEALKEDNINNCSIILRVCYKNFSMLLMGDAGFDAEEELLADFIPRTLILKVGHHGSSTATSASFLDALRPEAAVISVGLNNKFHHPHGKTLERLKDAGVKVFRTDQNGTVDIFTDGEQYSVLPQK